MITNRKLFSILIIIAVLFLLFQGTMAIRESMNHYGRNNFREETGLSVADTPDPADYAKAHRVLFIGDEESEEGKTVAEWAKDIRYVFTSAPDASRALSLYPDGDYPSFVCIQGSRLKTNELSYLQKLLDAGTALFFTSLPEPSFIRGNADLMAMLGIRDVRAEEVSLTGVRLYSGFLLGGERVYEAETREEERQQDLDLTVPWYVTGSGTETYMNGLFSEEETNALGENADELLPALLWRNSIGASRVFSVVGNYMENRQIGLGFLSAALAHTSSYAVYPVINAQDVTCISFPTAANENSDRMQEIYGRTMLQVESRLILPKLESLGLQEGYAFTGAFTSRLRSDGGGIYEAGAMDDFLSHMNEMSCELGISLVEDDSLTPAERAKETREYLESQNVTYNIGSAVVSPADLTGDASFLDDALLQNLQTVSCVYDDAMPVAGYDASVKALTEKNLTLQQITWNAEENTYTRNLELLGTETALAYTNWSLDLTSVLLPSSEDDQWQLKSKEMFANLTAGLSPFKSFAKTTLSEGDAAVRRYEALNYSDERSGDTVTLSLSGRQGTAYFLFRVSGEEVEKVTGGSFTKVEDGTYLIAAENDWLKLILKKNDMLTSK